MANSKSTYLRNAIYNAIWRGVSFTAPAAVYMSAHTASPGLTGANEVTGNGYARQAVTVGAPAGGTGSNTTAPTFPGPTPATYGTLTHIGYWDAASGGNFLGGDVLTAPIVTSVNVPVAFPAGNLTYTET